jgi:hypothetical protein
VATNKAKTKETTAFSDVEEERRFWETHSLADYIDQMRPVRGQVSKEFSDRVKLRKSR